MATKSKSTKGCGGPQPLSEDQPAHDWTLERLGDYAKGQYSRILEGERTLSPYYWRLGQALTIARKNFAHGQWLGYLESLEIDKTRASKACAIFRAFSTPAAVETLSVEEAYEARRPQPAPEPRVEISGGASLKFIGALEKVEKFVDDTFAEPAIFSADEKEELLATLRHTIRTLQEYERRLEGELAAADDSQSSEFDS